MESAAIPPLTLAVLASVLQMHGADAALGSDNKGIEDVLAPILGQLHKGADDPSESMIMAARNYGRGGSYGRRIPPYLRSMPRQPPSGTQSPGLPGAGTRR